MCTYVCVYIHTFGANNTHMVGSAITVAYLAKLWGITIAHIHRAMYKHIARRSMKSECVFANELSGWWILPVNWLVKKEFRIQRIDAHQGRESGVMVSMHYVCVSMWDASGNCSHVTHVFKLLILMILLALWVCACVCKSVTLHSVCCTLYSPSFLLCFFKPTSVTTSALSHSTLHPYLSFYADDSLLSWYASFPFYYSHFHSVFNLACPSSRLLTQFCYFYIPANHTSLPMSRF